MTGAATAADARAMLGAIGSELRAAEGGPGERRAERLRRALAGETPPAIDLNDLSRLPRWMRLPLAAQRRLAQRVALASIADSVASSIDGGWLGGLARIAGDDAVDWAASQAGRLPTGEPAVLAPDELERHGFALLLAQVPPPLRSRAAIERPDAANDAWITAALRASA